MLVAFASSANMMTAMPSSVLDWHALTPQHASFQAEDRSMRCSHADITGGKISLEEESEEQ